MGYIAKKLINENKNIAVLYGGLSNEKEISLRSGKNCYEALLRLGYKNIHLIDVDENISNILREKNIEVAYNALHGRFGEDGCIQGVLELLKIPYTGCGVMASALCMNKYHTKNMLKSFDVPLIKSVCLDKNKNSGVLQKVKDLKYPLILKPVTEGSSIGMYKVCDQSELLESFEKALGFTQDILIEEFTVGTEVTVGVLGDGNDVFATEILQLQSKNGWYDFEAKYTQGLTEFILPARLSESVTQRTKELAVRAFKACGCSGVSRIDFIVTEEASYVLEINTSPGMTDLSDLPAQSLAMGIDYDNLVQIILNSAGLNK